jgi:ribosomal protein S18 acetylase RimI-like enzyme
LLAIEGERIDGLALLYADTIVQLRGRRKAVMSLLDSVNFQKVELQAPLDCEDLVIGKYKPSFKHELLLMRLSKGEERLHLRHVPVKLRPEDLPDAVEVLAKADPEFWGDLDVEKQRVSWADAYIVGIRHEGRLASVGLTRFVDIGSNIGAIATEEKYRNMSYATSIVSALVKEIMQQAPPALIHVLSDNAQALHVYSKVGFKEYKRYLFIRGEKISH